MAKAIISIIITLLLFANCGNKSKKVSWEDFVGDTVLVIETDTLKKVKWHRLNQYIKYYELHKLLGKPDDSSIIWQDIAYLKDGKYVQEKINDSIFRLPENDFYTLLMDSIFFRGKNQFDFLLSIKSEIIYVFRPYLLDTITIHLKENSNRALRYVESELKSLPVINQVVIDSFPLDISDTLLHNTKRRKFLKVTLKESKKSPQIVKKYCRDFEKIKMVDRATFNGLYTDYFKYERIVRVRRN